MYSWNTYTNMLFLPMVVKNVTLLGSTHTTINTINVAKPKQRNLMNSSLIYCCLLYTSDAADEL